MRTTLTKYSFIAVSAALFVAGSLNSSFAGPEPIDSSKDKVVMAPPPVCDPRWYISIGGSVDPDLGSDFSNGFQETFIFDDDDDDTVDVDIVARDWDDLYNDWWNVRAEVGYALTNHIELFGKFEYTRAESQIVIGDTVFIDPNSFPGPYDLEFVSQWGDYESWGGELGIRYFFLNKEAAIRPYVSVSGGVAFVDAIGLRADSELFGDNITFYEGPFYDDSVVPTVSALLGVEFKVLCNFYVGVDAGVKWTGELDGDDSGFESSSVNGMGTNSSGNFGFIQSVIIEELHVLNDNGADRLSFPVTVYGKFRF